MRHVVLDTNALIQALPTRSRYHKIWSDFLAGKYCLCVSNEILSEYEEILSVHASPEVAQNVVNAFAEKVTAINKDLERFPETGYPEPLLKDRKKLYRARHVLSRFKIIYYYNVKTDTVHVADIWDMRRDPAKLANRIK